MAGFLLQPGTTQKLFAVRLITSKTLPPFSIWENGFTKTSVRTLTDGPASDYQL